MTKLESKFSKIKEQFNQYVKDGKNFDDYFNNCVRIVIGMEPIDYNTIGHKNICSNGWSDTTRIF